MCSHTLDFFRFSVHTPKKSLSAEQFEDEMKMNEEESALRMSPGS